MKQSLGDRIFSIFNITVLVLVGLCSLFPLYYVFVISFTEPSKYISKRRIAAVPTGVVL